MHLISLASKLVHCKLGRTRFNFRGENKVFGVASRLYSYIKNRYALNFDIKYIHVEACSQANQSCGFDVTAP